METKVYNSINDWIIGTNNAYYSIIVIPDNKKQIGHFNIMLNRLMLLTKVNFCNWSKVQKLSKVTFKQIAYYYSSLSAGINVDCNNMYYSIKLVILYLFASSFLYVLSN